MLDLRSLSGPRRAVSIATAALLVLITVPAWAGGLGDAFNRALEKGPVYAGIAAFIGGLGASLTPCVYPMIAVTVAVFGAKKAKSRWHAMGLSSVYVLGIAAMYTPLGVVAGLTGSLFGSALGNPWVVGAIAIIFFVLALAMFGAFEFVLPSSLTNKAATVGGVGFLGAFLLGLVSGIVCAPCTGPVMTGILIMIGKTQNPWLGGVLLFLFSLGLGVPFWLVGTFAISLPKSGAWMNSVKSFFGVVLLVAGLYFLKNALPQVTKLVPVAGWVPIAAMILAVAGLAAGAIHLGFDEGRAKAARKLVAIVASVLGLIVAITWLEKPRVVPQSDLVWSVQEAEALAQAKAQKRPVLIDFTAEWCAACKELARVTFTQADVRGELDRFVLLKIDATNDDDPVVADTQKRYKVAGLPTVIILDSAGTERLRYTEFVEPPRFFAAIKDVK
ncbi:MAG: thioredoxin family protein [Deltaproteobacteria bacterium]|nr:thioredoxin family protein [Deltaproteobacteria bacterium]